MIQKMFVSLFAALGALTALTVLGGCSTVQEKAAKAASVVVTQYCSTPQEGRAALRTLVNEAIAPNSIAVTCASDSTTATSN
jgi:ABC-type glycerol-3-phosphate transport system substrate-binding protein